MSEKKVRICKKCSGISMEEIKNHSCEKEFSYGCIGKCLHRCPELKGTYYGYINGSFEITLTEKDFLDKIKACNKSKA